MIPVGLLLVVSCLAQPVVLSPELEDLARAGLTARQEGDLELAKQHLARLVEQVPEFLPAHLNLGLVQYELSNYVKAVDSFRNALALNANNPEVYPYLGHSLLEAGHYSDAAETLQKALEKNPTDFKLRFWLAQAYTDLKQINDATRLLESLQTEVGNDPELLRQQILIQGKRSGPLRRQLMQIAPNSVSAKITAAEVLTVSGDHQQAISIYTNVLLASPSRRKVRLALGDLLFHQGSYKEAETLFREEMAMRPASASPRIRLGDVLLRQGQGKAAEPVLKKALELDNMNIEVLELLAKSLTDQKEYQTALESLQQAVSIETGDVALQMRIHYRLAQLQFRLGQRDAAEQQMLLFKKMQETQAGTGFD